mmetsp:Transcript_29485/g.40716  ORF Transcript_29485/g.40716 Transcript_29485/m.40716 type:complete len:227 (-) Transcript_29485:25-705(-)
MARSILCFLSFSSSSFCFSTCGSASPRKSRSPKLSPSSSSSSASPCPCWLPPFTVSASSVEVKEEEEEFLTVSVVCSSVSSSTGTMDLATSNGSGLPALGFLEPSPWGLRLPGTPLDSFLGSFSAASVLAAKSAASDTTLLDTASLASLTFALASASSLSFSCCCRSRSFRVAFTNSCASLECSERWYWKICTARSRAFSKSTSLAVSLCIVAFLSLDGNPRAAAD